MKYSILPVAIAAVLLLGACTTFGTGSSDTQSSAGYRNAADNTSSAGAGGGAGTGAGPAKR